MQVSSEKRKGNEVDKMALIKCPECGKQISDKAEICIGCGYPIAKYVDYAEKSSNEEVKVQVTRVQESTTIDSEVKELTKSLDEIYALVNGKKTLMIKAIREETNCSLKDAQNIVNNYWKEKFPEKKLTYTPQKELPPSEYPSIDLTNRYIQPEEKKKDHKIKCPKCGSIEYQIVGTKKKFSVGKALVGNVLGGVVLGPVGALAGTFSGVHGKDGKTKFVCNKCGKIWEQKI